MADGYVAQFTARVALDKKDIADQLLSQFKDLQAQADKNQIVYKFTGDVTELQGILKELQSKEIKLGTDVVIETSERDIQKQIDSLKSLLTKKARGIGDALKKDIANAMQESSLSLTDLIKLEGIGKSATSKNVIAFAESIKKELSNFDITALPFDKLEERLRFFESVRRNLGDINDIVGDKLKIDSAEFDKAVTNIYKKAASYFGSDAGKDSIRQTIQNLQTQMQEMHEKIAPLAKTLSDLLSGKNINQSTTEQQVEKLNQELSEVNTELEKQLELRNQILKSSSPTHDYSAFTERALGGRAAQQVMTIQDMIAKNEDASAALDELYALNQEIIKRHAKVAGQARINDLLKDYQPKTQNSQLEQIDKAIDKLIEKQKELQGQLATPVSNEVVNLESVSATDEEIKQLTADIEDLQNDLTSVKEKAASDLNAAEQEMARIREELERTQKTLDTLSGSPDASDKLKDLAEQLKEAEKDFMEKAAELYEAKNAQSALQEKYNEQAKTIQDYEKELASLRSELKKTQDQIDQFHEILGGKPDGYIEAKDVLSKVAAGEIASFDLFEQTWKQLAQSYTSKDQSATQQHFNKAATYYGTYVDQMKEAGKEYKRLVKDIDGTTRDFTEQLLTRWEVLKNTPDSQPEIIKQHNALVQEKQNIEQSIQTTRKKINILKEEQRAEQEVNLEIEKGNQKRKERVRVQKPVEQQKSADKNAIQAIKPDENGNLPNIAVYPETNAAVAREWKDKLSKMVAQLKIPVNVSPNSENTEKFQNILNEQLKNIDVPINIRPEIDISQWRNIINNSVVSLKTNIPIAFDVGGEQQKALRSAATHLVAYNNTLFGKHPEGIISQHDIDLATKGREEILQLYPALEKYKKSLSIINDEKLISASQEHSIKTIQGTLESIVELLGKHKQAIESEGLDISKIIDSEVESFRPLLAILDDVEQAVIAKTKQFQIEGDIVPGVIKIEWNQLNQLLILLNKIKVNIGSISKTKININYVDTIKSQQAKADKENKSQVYATYKEMLDAYKKMAAAKAILDTADNPLNRDIAKNEYLAAEEIFKKNRAIIEQNQEIISQEKVIQDLSTIDNRLQSKVSYSDAGKTQKNVLLSYKQMLQAYKRMAEQQVILETSTDKNVLNNAQLAYDAAEATYLQKKKIVDANERLIDQEKKLVDLNDIEVDAQQKINKIIADKTRKQEEEEKKQKQRQQKEAEKEYRKKEAEEAKRIKREQIEAEKQNKSRVYAAYKEMLDAYKKMAEANATLSTTDNPLNKNIANNEYREAEKVFNRNRDIIEQNQTIISQEKVIQDLTTIDKRLKSKVDYSNAEKTQKNVLLYYKQMLQAYKKMAEQQVILETSTDENILNNAQLAYDAAEETYLQKKKIVDANKNLIDQEKELTDLNDIEVTAQQKINKIIAEQAKKQKEETEKQEKKQQKEAEKERQKKEAEEEKRIKKQQAEAERQIKQQQKEYEKEQKRQQAEADKRHKQEQAENKRKEKEEENNANKLSKLQEKYQKKYEDFTTNRGTEPFSENYEQLLSEYKKQLQALQKFDFSSGTIEQLQEIEQKLKDITNQINRTKGNAEFTLVNKEDIAAQIAKLEKFMRKNDAMSNALRVRYQDIVKSLQDAFNNGITEIDYSKIIQQIKELDIEFHRAGKSGRTMWERIKASARGQTAHFVGMYLSIQDWIRYLRQGINTVIELDTALTELRKVSDASTNRLQQSLKESTKTAQELGASIGDVINMTADWARLGYSIDEAERLANITTLFKNVGDNMNADDASSYLISTMRGFQIAADDAEMIVDKYNEVANNFAIDTAGIGEALQRSAASFNAANTSLSESIALITATNSVVQNPESVGTLWKTLSARIRGAKTELEDLGEEADKYTETTSKLRDLVMSLTGFDIMADENTFKSVYDIIIGIGKEWDKLTDIEQASLGEALAGKRNANALYAVLGNIDQLEEAYMAAENAAGSAEKEQENYAKSIQYSIDQIKASLAALTSDILDSQSIKNIVDFGTDALQFIDELITRNKRLETLRNILLIIIRLIVVKFAQDGAKKLKKAFDVLVSATRNFYAGLKTAARGIKSFNSDIDQLTEEEKAATAAVKSLSNALITIGIAIASYIITEAVNYMNNIADAAQNATDNLNENAEQLSNYISSIQSLRNKLDDSNTTTSEAIEYNTQLRDIQKELIKLYGDAAGEIDIFNGSLEEQGGIISQLNELSSSDVAQQKWLNEVNNRSFGQKVLRAALTPYIGESTAILLDHFFGTNFSVVLKNNFDALNQKYESFSRKIKATSDDTLNYIIGSYDNIELKDGMFEISGNVEDVQATIIDIQTRLKSYAGYTEDFNAQLTEVYNKAADIQSKFGDTYNQGLAFAVGNDETAREFQEQLNSAFTEFDNATTDKEKAIVGDRIANIVQAIQDSELDQALQNYLIKQADSYGNTIARITLSSWKAAIDYVGTFGGTKELYRNPEYFGEDYEDTISTPAFGLIEKLANGAYVSADVQNMYEPFQMLADVLRVDVEQLLELLRLLGLLDNKEAIIAQLTSGHRTAAKDYIAEQIANTDDGMEIYNALLSSGGAAYLESAEGMTYVKQFFDNYRNTIIVESDKTKKTIDAWFDKNGDFVDDYQKNLASINEAISGYYSGTLSPDDMIDLYQEFPEIIESSDDLGTALKKLRVKQIEKLYDELGEDVPDKLRLELQRLEDQANQTAEILNNFSFENSAQSLKDGVEMIQSLNARFEDGERGFDTIFSDDFINVFGKYKKEYSALIKTIETKGFKTNKKLQEQARQQANALGNAWIKDNLGLLNEEQLNAAKAIFEEMGVQIEGVAMAIQTIEEAQQAAADAGLDWNNITANSIQQLLTEGVVTAQTAREIIYYKMQELAAGNASIDTSTSIENLLMLQATLQSVGVSLAGFQNMIARINSLKTMRANGLTRDKITGEDYYDQWVKEAIDGWVNKPVEIPDASDFGNGKDNNGGGGGSDEKDAAEEIVDWIEKLIDRLERKLSHLEKVAGSAYETWETRAGALSEAIGATTAEIEAQRAAYDRYMQEAANVGLDENYAQKVRDGALDIETITDEELKDKISKYEEYYTAALDAEEKIYDLTLHLSELAQQQFELIQTKFEKMITSLEADITHLQNEIDDIFQKTLSTSYDELIAMRRQEMDLLQQEYNELTQSLADSVAAGYITEGTEAWYDMDTAIKEVSNSLQEQRNTIHELIKEQFDLIDTLYSNIINNLSLRYDKMEAAINHLETVGFVESEGIYRRQMTEELNNLSKYYDELQEQQNAFNNAVAQGMEEGSDAWFEMQDAINSTWNSIIECISSIDDLQVKLWELDWSKFDHAQNMIQNVIDESNFLIGMFDEISLIDDYGFFTSNGVATEGLHMQNYQTMKQQAQMYLDAIHDIEDIMNGNYDLNSETFTYLTEEWSRLTGLEADPEMWAEELRTNDKLLQRKQELIDAYQGAIQGAEDEKDAIIDLINQAYDAQLAYINKLIDAKKEQLDADKALYEYSKNVEEQTKNIGTLQNQLAAIANDNSEEAMARRQKLQAELDEAQKQLDETQYDKWYNDQQEMLDKLSEEYGEMIDEVKKNEDKNFAQIQEYLDANLEEVHGALDEVADKVGYEIQENAFSTIWGSSSTMSDVLGGVQSSIDTIIAFNERMYAVATNLSDWFTRWLGMDSTITDETSARNFVNGLYQTFLDRDADEAGFQDWYEQLRNGATVEDIIKGFVFSDEYMAKNKSDREIIEDLYQAILGRNGEDAGIANWLDYLKKGATWEDVIRGFVESTEFSESGQWERLLDDWLDVDSGYGNSILSGLDDTSRLNDEWFQHWLDNLNKKGRVSVIIEPTQGAMGNISIDTLNFDLPNVTDYQSFVKAAQSDPNFEKMVQSMTVNKIAGGSSLAKYKY